MKTMKKSLALVAAVLMILSTVLSLAYYVFRLTTGMRMTGYILVMNMILPAVTTGLFAAALFRGKKDILGTAFLGSFAIVYLIYMVRNFTVPNLLMFLAFVALALVCSGMVKLPKVVGIIIVAVLSVLALVITLAMNIKMLCGDRVSGVREVVHVFRFMLKGPTLYFLNIVIRPIFTAASLITASIAVSGDAKETAPQLAYGQAPYQPMPQGQPAPQYQQPVYAQPQQAPQYQQPVYAQPQQAPQYQQPVYAQPQQAPQYQQPVYGQPQQAPQYQQPVYGQPQYQAPQYQQPVYGQPQYQAPQYQQPVYAQPQYQPVPQEQPATQEPAVPEETQQ